MNSKSPFIKGKPFHWDKVRRAQLRAELDANYARLYGLTCNELGYVKARFIFFKSIIILVSQMVLSPIYLHCLAFYLFFQPAI